MRAKPLTAGLAATGLVAGYGVAVASGSRPLGGLLLAACGLACIAIWSRRHVLRTTVLLTGGGLLAFALSHALGLLIGPWPAVILTAGATFGAYWKLSDSRRPGREIAGAPARS